LLVDEHFPEQAASRDGTALRPFGVSGSQAAPHES
jgi:hypothetical protein